MCVETNFGLWQLAELMSLRIKAQYAGNADVSSALSAKRDRATLKVLPYPTNVLCLQLHARVVYQQG